MIFGIAPSLNAVASGTAVCHFAAGGHSGSGRRLAHDPPPFGIEKENA